MSAKCHERTSRQPSHLFAGGAEVDREPAFWWKKLSDVATILHGVSSAILKGNPTLEGDRYAESVCFGGFYRRYRRVPHVCRQ